MSLAFVPVSIAITGPLSLLVPVETIFVVAGTSRLLSLSSLSRQDA